MNDNLNLAFRVVHEEHEQMPKICEKCGGKMSFLSQGLRADEEPGDYMTYGCMECETTVTKFFPFPEEYAKVFRTSNTTAKKEMSEND